MPPPLTYFSFTSPYFSSLPSDPFAAHTKLLSLPFQTLLYYSTLLYSALKVFKALGGSSFPRDALFVQTIHSEKACAVVSCLRLLSSDLLSSAFLSTTATATALLILR